MNPTPLFAIIIALAITGAAGALTKYSTRTLSDNHIGSSTAELVAQRDYSAHEVKLLRRSWLVAPRHATCWSHVPWAKTCDHARRKLHAQRYLLAVATKRLTRRTKKHIKKLYPYCHYTGNRQLGCIMASQRGWGPGFSKIDRIITQESGWSTTAKNASGACGIPQDIRGCEVGYDPKRQIDWLLDYLGNRYGGPNAAYDHKLAYGWY